MTNSIFQQFATFVGKLTLCNKAHRNGRNKTPPFDARKRYPPKRHRFGDKLGKLDRIPLEITPT